MDTDSVNPRPTSLGCGFRPVLRTPLRMGKTRLYEARLPARREALLGQTRAGIESLGPKQE